MNIRNFCIIAHIDHGKSTLADRFLELTGTVEKRKMREQILDQMELERERGITIKLAPVRMHYVLNVLSVQNVVNDKKQFEQLEQAKRSYILNLIDTPGHVDFTYEVSRSLAAVEGAVLLVDATQGVQAQTIGNLYLAMEQNLAIIPVINKIDLPNADIQKTKEEIIHLLGCDEKDISLCSAKTGEGVEKILEAVVERVPSPVHSEDELKALIFDSFYDDYRGVVASVRIVDGELRKGDKIKFMKTRATAEVLDVGHFSPQLVSDPVLEKGQIGYVVTGLKELAKIRVGDTITTSAIGLRTSANKNTTESRSPKSEVQPLPGYKEIKPMVFAGIFPKEGNEYTALRKAVEKLKLNDASLFFEPEHSQALGYGLRCGFLGMLHLDIFQERLKREFNLQVVVTVPSVAYRVIKTSGETIIIKGPQELPDQAQIRQIEEPWMKVDVIAPENFLGNVIGLVTERKGKYVNTEYLSSGAQKRIMLHYEMPLASLITDFYDKLKTATSGYASLNYELRAYEKTDVVRLDILVAEEKIESLSILVWREDAYKTGKQIVESLKETLPRQQFVLKIQAAIGGKIIAAERLSALRKDVTAKLYGGDRTRKDKLLKKQKKGKKKMLVLGRGKVDIPTEAYLAVLKR